MREMDGVLERRVLTGVRHQRDGMTKKVARFRAIGSGCAEGMITERELPSCPQSNRNLLPWNHRSRIGSFRVFIAEREIPKPATNGRTCLARFFASISLQQAEDIR